MGRDYKTKYFISDYTLRNLTEVGKSMWSQVSVATTVTIKFYIECSEIINIKSSKLPNISLNKKTKLFQIMIFFSKALNAA